MDRVLFRCRVRYTTREGDRVRLSHNWLFARRADLVLTETDMVCGDWSVPYSDIEDAVFVSVGDQRRLIVRTREKVFQFILPFVSAWSWNPVVDSFWHGTLPFRIRRIEGQIELRSIVTASVVFVGVLLLWLWLIGPRMLIPFVTV